MKYYKVKNPSTTIYNLVTPEGPMRFLLEYSTVEICGLVCGVGREMVLLRKLLLFRADLPCCDLSLIYSLRKVMPEPSFCSFARR